MSSVKVANILNNAINKGEITEAVAREVAAEVAADAKVSKAEAKAIQHVLDTCGPKLRGNAYAMLVEAQYFASSVKVTQTDLAVNNNVITLKPGESLTLALPSDRTSGSSWVVSNPSRTFGRPSASTYRPVATRGSGGSAGTEFLTWGSSPLWRSGDHFRVTLAYRNWRTLEDAPSKSIDITVKIV